MDKKDKDPLGGFIEGLLDTSGLRGPKEMHEEAIELILDHLTDGFVKAFHSFGRRAMGQLHLTETDCDDCGALLAFTVICPVNDFHFVLKETLKTEDFRTKLRKKIKQGRDFNERKGFTIEPVSERVEDIKPKGHPIKID